MSNIHKIRIKQNEFKVKLNLDCNYIGQEGAIAIADALKVNTSLTELDLKDNNIDPEGFNSFKSALSNNFSLIELFYDNLKLETIENILIRNKKPKIELKLPYYNFKYINISKLLGKIIICNKSLHFSCQL